MNLALRKSNAHEEEPDERKVSVWCRISRAYLHPDDKCRRSGPRPGRERAYRRDQESRRAARGRARQRTVAGGEHFRIGRNMERPGMAVGERVRQAPEGE